MVAESAKMLSDRVVALQRRAVRDLHAAAGDLSLCAIAKSGRPVPAVKYHEGRAAMLRDVARTLTRSGVDTQRWKLVLVRWNRLGNLAVQSQDWAAYLQGGKDVVDELGLAAGPP